MPFDLDTGRMCLDISRDQQTKHKKEREKRGAHNTNHTVKHIDAKRGANDEINGVSNTHEISWFVGRKAKLIGCANLDGAPKHVLALPAGKTSDRVTRGVSLGQLPQTDLSQFRVETSLDDRKEILLHWPLVGCDAPIDPG